MTDMEEETIKEAEKPAILPDVDGVIEIQLTQEEINDILMSDVQEDHMEVYVEEAIVKNKADLEDKIHNFVKGQRNENTLKNNR